MKKIVLFSCSILKVVITIVMIVYPNNELTDILNVINLIIGLITDNLEFLFKKYKNNNRVEDINPPHSAHRGL